MDMLKPLAPRQYSISSSPTAHPHDTNKSAENDIVTATITYDVHCAPARSGHNRTFHGVASTYLSTLTPNTRLHCYVRRTNSTFHLPQDPSVPLIMIGAGTGIAPFRGFIQERAALASAGAHALGPALLYFGCRDSSSDFIYKDEFAAWQAQGAVEVRPAFSKRGPQGEDGGKTFKYTHERMWAEREELKTLYKKGAKIFLCGSASKLAKSTAEVLKKIWMEANEGAGEDEAEKWLEVQKVDRYVSDVFD